MEADQFGRPTVGEVTRIEALPDDPGLNAWKEVKALRNQAVGSDAMRETLRNIGSVSATSDAMRETLRNISGARGCAADKSTTDDALDSGELAEGNDPNLRGEPEESE